MGRKIRDIKRGEVTTTANSTATLYTFTTTNNSTIVVQVDLIGRRNFNSDSFFLRRIYLFKNNAGTVTQVDSANDIFMSDNTINQSTLNANISGTNIEFSVTGDSRVASINWEYEIFIKEN
jgi:cold shock CspA family protein